MGNFLFIIGTFILANAIFYMFNVLSGGDAPRYVAALIFLAIGLGARCLAEAIKLILIDALNATSDKKGNDP